jgi:Fic family protein
VRRWLEWFFGCLRRAIESSSGIVGKVLKKAAFWQKHAIDITNETQREILNKLMDDFTGNMTSGKAAKIFKISQDTAIRLLKDLTERGFLSVRGAGRSTHYIMAEHK